MIQFIDVNESLPDIDVEVLIRIPVYETFNVENGKYRGDGNWDGAWCTSRGKDHCYKVTHWAPMPEVKP